MKEHIMSATSEVWEMAKQYDFTNAYKETNRKPVYPRPDYMKLDGHAAERLYRIGKSCKPVHQREAALPLFSVEIMGDFEKDDDMSLWDFINPKHNKNSDRELSIYGVTLLFSSDAGQIACDIGFHYSDHSGGGYEEIGTVGIMADGDYFFSFPHYMELIASEDFGLYDYESITKLCNWPGYFWRGIQHEFIYRPEVIRVKHHRLSTNERTQAANQVSPKYRIAKVQRVITILLDEDAEIDVVHTGGHSISLSLWSVSGHWRITKSGKRVWIAPYYKGKDRSKKNSEFCPKEYRFAKEVSKNA